MSILSPDIVQQINDEFKLSTYMSEKVSLTKEDTTTDQKMKRFYRHQANEIARMLGFKSIQGLWSTIRKQNAPNEWVGWLKMTHTELINGIYTNLETPKHIRQLLLQTIIDSINTHYNPPQHCNQFVLSVWRELFDSIESQNITSTETTTRVFVTKDEVKFKQVIFVNVSSVSSIVNLTSYEYDKCYSTQWRRMNDTSLRITDLLDIWV